MLLIGGDILKYIVEIQEILQKQVEVEAKSLDEALDIVRQQYYDGGVELLAEDLKETNFQGFFET